MQQQKPPNNPGMSPGINPASIHPRVLARLRLVAFDWFEARGMYKIDPANLKNGIRQEAYARWELNPIGRECWSIAGIEAGRRFLQGQDRQYRLKLLCAVHNVKAERRGVPIS